MQADFVMIVAKMSGITLEEVVIEEAGSDMDKKLLSKSPLGTYPMLEVSPDGPILCDAISIATYLAASSEKGKKLLGSSEVETA